MALPRTGRRSTRRLPDPIAAAPVATTLAVIARELAASETGPVLVDQLLAVVPRLFATADHAGLVLVTPAGLAPAAATDDVARRLDQTQLDQGQGPTLLTAGGDADALLIDDVHRDDRWPDWRSALPPSLLGSCLSLRLDSGRGAMGGLTLYAAAPRAFSAETVAVGTALAIHAGLALAAVAKKENLGIAMDSRDVIGQAKGILMERHRMTAGEAFDAMVRASQRTDRTLRDVADELALTGHLTSDRLPR